jgi:hypothetical protein
MPISRAAYFINPNNNDQQAVVLYSNGSTEIWDRDGSKRLTTGGDRFDDYCNQISHSGYQPDDNPGWQAPSEP